MCNAYRSLLAHWPGNQEGPSGLTATAITSREGAQLVNAWRQTHYNNSGATTTPLLHARTAALPPPRAAADGISCTGETGCGYECGMTFFSLTGFKDHIRKARDPNGP